MYVCVFVCVKWYALFTHAQKRYVDSVSCLSSSACNDALHARLSIQDLGEGIDLDDTDGEDASEEEEDSEEERRVAEGFLEDAKYAGEVNPDLLRRAHMDLTDQDEKRMTERILDVVRGEARRRTAAKENDEWIPNRGARERLQNAYGGGRGGADRPDGDDAEEVLDGDEEEEEARIAAVLANERLERLRFIQQARELQMQAESGDEQEEARQPARPAPMVRKVSCAVPSLAEFGSKLTGAGLARSVSGSLANGAQPAGRMQLKRGSSLLGSLAGKPADSPGHQQPAALATGKVFFFDTRQRSSSDAAAAEMVNSPEPMSMAPQETPAVSPRLQRPPFPRVTDSEGQTSDESSVSPRAVPCISGRRGRILIALRAEDRTEPISACVTACGGLWRLAHD
jgi:hypothetical protein